jgi:lipopolysaccharide cholinephosphotransferase
MKNDVPYPDDSLARLQAELKRLLVILDEVCDELGIDYFIDSGTALGAARHGGFIPWDDDVDVAMMYGDYVRFQRDAPGLLPEGFSMHTTRDTDGFTPLWTKIWIDGTRFIDHATSQTGCSQGIFLDVFPYVYLPDNETESIRMRKRLVRLQRMSYLTRISEPVGMNAWYEKLACKAAHAILEHATSPVKLQDKFDEQCVAAKAGDMITSSVYAQYNPIPFDAIYPTKRVEFDGVELSAPGDTEAYLTAKYGDWRALPPMEKRYTHAPLVLDFGDGVNVIEG